VENDIDDMSFIATTSMKMTTKDRLPTSYKKDKIPIKVMICIGKQPQFHSQNMPPRVFKRDIDNMSWVATNFMKIPMNDMPSTSHKKDKMPINAVTSNRELSQSHSGNKVVRVSKSNICVMSWVATNSMKIMTKDILPTSHKKDKMPIKVMIGIGKQLQYHSLNMLPRVGERDIDDMAWVATIHENADEQHTFHIT
jgi:hypothetical protein